MEAAASLIYLINAASKICSGMGNILTWIGIVTEAILNTENH